MLARKAHKVLAAKARTHRRTATRARRPVTVAYTDWTLDVEGCEKLRRAPEKQIHGEWKPNFAFTLRFVGAFGDSSSAEAKRWQLHVRLLDEEEEESDGEEEESDGEAHENTKTGGGAPACRVTKTA